MTPISRLERGKRLYEELKIKDKGGLLDLFDNSIKETFRINDDEYNYIAINGTDEDLDIFIGAADSFADKRKLILMVEKYIDMYNKSKK